MPKKRYSNDEALLIGLDKIAKSPSETEDRRKVAESLKRWYLRTHEFTFAQREMAKKMVALKPRKIRKPPKYHLYAITDGESVKLGVSTNIAKRIKSMQTGCPNKLSLIWKLYLGRDKTEAYRAERRLHRFCNSYKIHGEWFAMECMERVVGFR